MNENEFKATYIAQFLASYMASRYDADCQAGHPGDPYLHMPIEDAAFLANCAWEQVKAFAAESKSVSFNTLYRF